MYYIHEKCRMRFYRELSLVMRDVEMTKLLAKEALAAASESC